LIIQADSFNRSRIQTVLAITISSNLRLARAPGNVLLVAASTGLPTDSVANVSQIVTLDRNFLVDLSGRVDDRAVMQIERGLRQVLDL
jgi:mRNA interferase MazF